MSDPWPTLSNIMSTEWIGPDEIAAEADFADAMEELFVSCQGIVVESQINLAQSAEGWKKFTAGNTIEGGSHQPDMSGVSSIEYEVTEVQSLDLVVTPAKSFEAEDIKTKSAQSQEIINDAIDDYTKSVYNGVKGLYEVFDEAVGAGFLGSDQKTAINNYLKRVGVVLGKVAVCVKKLKVCVAEAAAGNVSQSGQSAAQFNEQNPTLADESNVNYTGGQ